MVVAERSRVCCQPKDPGPCKALFPRWYYNSATSQCEQFNYGGCQGNRNNFETKAACEKTCVKCRKCSLQTATDKTLNCLVYHA